ncbi:MAG TPA: alpha/beta fold hydrolase BchO [Acetobacteraceae bacterium]|nr:alpha/beta fold hydrolase BchO [Acetobacteraceae bacterium]
MPRPTEPTPGLHHWPQRDHSRFVTAAGRRWHVQVGGNGPALLLLHGTGASSHSWRDLTPVLARHFTVIAPDLPGHGLTEMPPPALLSLPAMAWGLRALLAAMRVSPALAAGHSAGAAILARMCLDGAIAPRILVSVNGAMLPMGGLAGQVFAPVARLFALSPVVPALFAWRAADRAAVARMLRGTGSALSEDGIAQYARLLRQPGHVQAALGMMARWDLAPLERDLRTLRTRLLLVVGENDRAILPTEAGRVRALVPSAEILRLPGLGHLAHEEDPARVIAIILHAARDAGTLAAD